MSAPAHEKPATEQPTQPLPVSETLPGGGNWLMSKWSVLLIPSTILAAIGSGEAIRAYVATTEALRFEFALTLLAGLLALVSLAYVIPRLTTRGLDGRS
jgi:hypothetical protein